MVVSYYVRIPPRPTSEEWELYKPRITNMRSYMEISERRIAKLLTTEMGIPVKYVNCKMFLQVRHSKVKFLIQNIGDIKFDSNCRYGVSRRVAPHYLDKESREPCWDGQSNMSRLSRLSRLSRKSNMSR